MKQIFTALILGALLLAFWACEKKEANIIYDKSYIDEIKQARNDFAYFLTKNYIPGGNIAIAKNNKIIYSEGMGLASKDLGVPMTRENSTRIGTASQIFTFIIYQKLVEEGILEPDSTVQHYLKDYPETNFKLKLKHLPYHTSGIRKENQDEAEINGINLTLQKGLEFFMNEELSTPPGWFEEMSVFNPNLLAAVMESATGKKFPQLLKEYITDTLHLSNTFVDNPAVTIEGRTNFYTHDMLGKVINAPYRDLRYMAPSKGILSNAEDLVKLGMAILDSDYFSEKFRQLLFEPCDLYGGYKSKMANGWILTIDQNGRDLNASSGSVTGGGAAILIYPDEELVIAYAVNLTLGNNFFPLSKIADYFLDGQQPGNSEN